MTSRVLNVWWGSRVVGQFTQDRHGDIAFRNANEWLVDQTTPPVSASLPKRPEQFSRRECRPFFGGLLPEESQRLVSAQALGVSPGSDFALLDRLGGDVAAAL
ncbi:HipA-like protein [Neorhizobium alkalisoli]|uniref:HipA-like protein n=1 Tax=Neorhizobium alkalisoli TaxID=528178 RepID=A0A561QB65_9HYPH|nr:HipA-like protein [Neorhizobium alkalisoli]